jgi:D-threo-aldose 1-dehydrogenase
LGGLFVGIEGKETGIAVVRRALELGVNLFDTAPSYFGNASQEVLGEALDGAKEQHFISTKIGPSPDSATAAAYDYDSIMKLFEENLKTLRRDYIDILHIHDPDRYGDPGCPGNLNPVFGKGMALETLQKLKEQKLIGAIGIASLWCDFQAYCIDSNCFDVILTFNRFGLIWRDAQFQTFPFCRKRNVGVMQGTPFHQGVLLWPNDDWRENPPDWMTREEHARYVKLLDIQKKSGIPLTELAIRFILSNETVSTTIPGAANIEQLEANVRAADAGPLPVDIQAEIESLGILHTDPRRYY